jgi:hypothetical protein
VPLVRYDPRYAETIGKWMLNAANAARLFYPNEIPDAHQTLPEKKNLTRNVIAYEGLKKTDIFGIPALEGVSPVALGDGPLWTEGNPDVSQFSLYGSAHAGIYGAIIQKTSVEGILRLDCLATDFFRGDAYPTYLIFNPHPEDKEIEYFYTGDAVYLYDVINQGTVANNVTETTIISIGAGKARLIVEIPEGTEIVKRNGKLVAGDVVITYR